MPETCVTELKCISPIANFKSYMVFLPAVVLTAGVAILSLMESPYVPQALSAKDKLIHGAMYMLLAISWMAPVCRRLPSRIMPYIGVWTGVVLYGALMEILQRFCTLTRSGEMADFYADAIGAILGLGLVALLSFIINRSTLNIKH